MNAFVVRRSDDKPSSSSFTQRQQQQSPQKQKIHSGTKRARPVEATIVKVQQQQQEEVRQVSTTLRSQIDASGNFEARLDALDTWFAKALADQRPGVELEGKVGRFVNGRFESMVPAALFNTHLVQCQRSASAGGIFDRTERETTITFLFANGVRGTQYSDQRSEFVHKRRISNYDVCFDDDVESDVAVRLSYNIETPCDPPCEKVQWVRVRQRESFYYKQTWRFDFTYVRQGATKSDATRGPLQHEIEIEYIGEPDRGDEARHLVASLLYKLHDMTNTAGTVGDPPRDIRILQHVVKECE